MIEPAFTEGLPPDGAAGLFLAHDDAGILCLLRWDAQRSCYAALGWSAGGHAEQHFLLPGNPAPSIAGHVPIAWTPPAPAEDAEWTPVEDGEGAALPGPEA